MDLSPRQKPIQAGPEAAIPQPCERCEDAPIGFALRVPPLLAALAQFPIPRIDVAALFLCELQAVRPFLPDGRPQPVDLRAGNGGNQLKVLPKLLRHNAMILLCCRVHAVLFLRIRSAACCHRENRGICTFAGSAVASITLGADRPAVTCCNRARASVCVIQR
jgi:hypothetical protein